MKKYLIILISIVTSFSLINTSNAWSLEAKLYKAAILSKNQIAKDYKNWELYNKKISEFFTNLRYKKDTKTLTKLETTLKKQLLELNSKKVLSRKQRIKLNLYNNIYYRTKLLLDYNL